MSEYEVESITQARVARKSKKVIWEYHVKWKGYSSDDNTWEPVGSFSGSEDIITKFWDRVDVGDRDIKNMTQFSIGETFIPIGPPRRKPTRRSTKPDTVVPTAVSAGPSNEGARSSKRPRSSPSADDVKEKPAKRTRGRESEPATRSVEESRAPRQPPRRPPVKTTASSTRSIRRSKKKRTPSPDFVPASEEEEEEVEDIAMLVDPQEQSFADPSDESPSQRDAPNQGPAESIQEEVSPSRNLPSHRARAANPLVKMVDDFEKMENAIAVKARVGNSGDTPVAGPSSSPTRKSNRKPGPGRSSAGMIGKSTSSLLTFEKGALKTVKGKFTAPVADRDGTEGNIGLFDGPDVPDSASPVVPPTSDELLQLGGLNSKAAEGLDDFEDEMSPAGESANNDANQQSLVAAKNNLFPPGASMTSTFSNKVVSVWRRATIFGPLGLGSDAQPESRSESKPFFLKLDATVSLPLDLTAATQSLDTLICDKPNGPSGKFFMDVNARKLLDTVRTGGPSARASISENASEEQKAHFSRFRSRLDQGELFTAMVDTVFLAFSSSETPLMQRLNLPPTLVSFADSVFVTQLVIENFTAYLEVAETADTSRW